MEGEKQLVLFFRQGTEINNVELASKLNSKFDCLKEPIVLPFNENNPAQPLIIFERGDIKISINISDVAFSYDRKIHNDIYNTIIEMVEYFEELDISFERMGYITTFIHDKDFKDNFKSLIFSEKAPIESEFQVSWYKKELIDSVSVNVWIKGLTDMINHVEFVSIYDINTPIDEVYNISSEFLRGFLKQCDKYIEEKELFIK